MSDGDSDAAPLTIPLTWGWDGTERALEVTLWALHNEKAIAFLAEWQGPPPGGEADTVYNKLTMHWRIPEPAAQGLDCTVVCHTAYVDTAGRVAYANAETIPPGGHGALDAAGGWQEGTWTLEWRRPLVSENPYDVQLDSPAQPYLFRIKVFERVEGRPDPTSAPHPLVLAQ